MPIETPEDLTASDLKWLIANTGFPTFDEFRKNPDAFRTRADELFVSADGSSKVFRDQVKSHRYMWKDEHLCTSLEQAETIAKNEGYEISDLEMIPTKRFINGTSQDGQVEIVIQFWPKVLVKLMGGVVANG